MSLKVKSISVRRKVNVLKQPTPTYVSFVDHAATQTPFAVVKNAHKKEEAPMKKRTSKQRTGTKTRKSTAPSADAQVYKLVFNQDTFKTENAVKSWLKKNQWTGDYAITDEDGEFVVKSKTAKAEDQFDLREVALDNDGSVSALVSKAKLGSSELSAKAIAKKPSTLGNAGVNEDESDPEGDGTDAAGSKASNAAASKTGTDDDEDEEDAGDDTDADEDDESDEGEDEGEGEGDEDGDGDEEETDLTADEGEDIDGNPAEDDGGDTAEGDYNHDNDPADDDAEGAEDAAAVDDAEGYGNRTPGGHASIRDKERNEPLPKDLPGQRVTPTGAGKPGHEPGIPGKNRIRRRKAAGRMPIASVDRLIRKYDSYGVYLSGGMTLKEVLEDGLSDGIPPGVSEVFQSLYKAVGNTLKSAKGAEISSEVTAIAGEFSEAVVALHEVWKSLLKNGTPAQKKAAKAYFAEVGTLQTSATPAKKAAPVQKQRSGTEEDRIAKAVAKAMAPLQEQLSKATKEVAALKKGVPARKSLGNDDLDHSPDPEKIRRAKEAEEDAEFLADRARKGLFGSMSRSNYDR